MTMFKRQQNRATPFASDSEALTEAQDRHQDRCKNSNGGISRHQTDKSRGNAHEQQRDHQGGFPPDAVSQVSEERATDGACDKAEVVGSK